MLTSFFALVLLISINQHTRETDLPVRNHAQTFHIAAFLIAGFTAIAILTSWWSFWRGPDLVTRLDNARRSISDRYVKRGNIVDRNFNPLSYTQGKSGDYERVYEYPEFSPLIGYTQPFFGQAGLESNLDPILRGLENQSPWRIWLNHLLYGQSPEGFDVQLSLDKELQLLASELLLRTSGAVVLLNSNSGEILVMYSSPFYDANTLTENWDSLKANPESPFVNRAIQSLYPPGPSLAPFLLTETSSAGFLPDEVERLKSPLDNIDLPCANPISLPSTWGQAAKAGCPGPLEQLGNRLGANGILALFKRVGFYETPNLRANLTSALSPASITNPAVAAIGQSDILVSPMQLALAAAVFNNEGERPNPKLILSAENHLGEWINYTGSDSVLQVFSPSSARQTAEMLAHPSIPIWETTAFALTDLDSQLTWYLAGTLPDQDQKLTVVVLLERFEPEFAARIGQSLILKAMDASY